MKVVTYQSPSSASANICDGCRDRLQKAGRWPRDHAGQELCTVSRGAHHGRCHTHPVIERLVQGAHWVDVEQDDAMEAES